MRVNKKSGFTLIELLVVIAIIGILAAFIGLSLTRAKSKARDAIRQSDAKQMQTALALYYSDNGEYPLSGGATSPQNGWSNSNDSSWTTLATALAPYMAKLPEDPLQSASGWAGAGDHTYAYYSQGYGCPQQWYMFVINLEIASGPDVGVTACDNTFFQYGAGGADTSIKTIGQQAR